MMRHHAGWIAAAGIAVILSAGPAMAQTPAQRPPSEMSPKNVPPDKFKGRPEDNTGSTKNLSDQLRESDGVIKPPATEGGGVIKPPDTGTTPVIPPPGSPRGSAPNAAPK